MNKFIIQALSKVWCFYFIHTKGFFPYRPTHLNWLDAIFCPPLWSTIVHVSMYKISMNVLNKLWYFIFPTQHLNTLPPTLSFIPHSLSSNLCLFPHFSDVIIVILILWLANYVCIEFFHTVTTGSQTTTPHNQNKILIYFVVVMFNFFCICFMMLFQAIHRFAQKVHKVSIKLFSCCCDFT